MTTMAQRATGWGDVRHHPVRSALLVFLLWIAAAVLVATCHIELDARSGSAGAAAAIASIVVVAYAYTRLCARGAGIDHALGVGIAWLLLAIVVEITITSRIGHGRYSLIGTPDHPLLRNIFLFVWVFAPAAFAQRQAEE